MNKILIYWITIAALLLSGCASTFTSQVTTFHEWPSDIKDKSYVLDTIPGQENNPEYNLYAELLHNKLQNQGFIMSKDDNAAALKVMMEYGTLLNDFQLSVPLLGLGYDPFWQIHYSRLYRRAGFYSPYYPARSSGIWMMSDVVATRYFLHQLAITITDRKSGKKLINIKVSAERNNPEIALQMPYLIDSAFTEFPGQNGHTINVEVPILK
jgi:Domain of unknown function (DUF4136)